MQIWINDLPLCPSTNEMLASVRGRLIKTKVSRQFDQMIASWIISNRREVLAYRDFIKDYLSQNKGEVLRVDSYHCFQHKRIWTKDGRPKRIDANNRVKACLDAVAKVLEVDDRYFFAGNCEKVVCSSKAEECSIVSIYPMEGRTKEQILEVSTRFHTT